MQTQDSTVLGRGEFGLVTAALFAAPRKHVGWQRLEYLHGGVLPTAPLVAVKSLLPGINSEATLHEVLPQLLLEARVLAAMQHPHLVTVVGVCEARYPVQIAMEYCSLGNLRNYLRADGSTSLLFLLDLAVQAAAGVEYLHSKLCIHRDLAARNLLLAPDSRGIFACGMVVKLGDLGLARMLRTEEDYYRVSREVMGSMQMGRQTS